MPRGESRRWANVRELSAALCSYTIGSAPALERHAPDLRDVLGAERSLSYCVSELGDRLSLRFLHLYGGGDEQHSRRAFDSWLRSWPSRTRFGAYNAMRPEPAQQNKAIVPRELVPEGTPVARALHAQLGIDKLGELRALICERGELLAWVGVLQSEPFTPFQRRALGELIAPLRARLDLERQLDRTAILEIGLEAVLEAMPGAAFVVSARGEILHANGGGRTLLSVHRRKTWEDVAVAMAGGGDAFLAVPFSARGQAPHHLILARSARSLLDSARSAAAAKRWQLTVRQREVLELLVQGRGNDEIAKALGCARSTVEKHVAALFDAIGVDSRAAVIAAFVTFE